MISTHVYTAALIGDPDTPLSVKGGRITLDESQAPHVQASIDIALPATATLDALDPRAGARVRVVADAVYPSFSVTRTFDLGLRSRPRLRREATVTLELASDEALLLDWSPLEDVSLYDHRGSLRAIVNQVLGTVIPGAALEATPALDADCTPYWDSENLIPNPNATVDTTGWVIYGSTGTLTPGGQPGNVPGGNPGGFVAAKCTTTTATYFGVRYDTVPNVNEKTMYTASGYIYQNSAATHQVGVWLYFLNEAGTIIDYVSKTLYAEASTWTPASVTGFAPTGTVAARVLYTVVDGITSGASVYATGCVLAEGTLNDEWFSGSKTDTAHYTYAWQGAANASLSTRTALIERSLESLTWTAGDSALEFLQPLVQVAGYRLVCDENRRWTLRGEDYSAAGAVSIREGVNLIDRRDTIDRDAGTWFDAQITRYIWRGAHGDQKTKVDAYALTTPYTRLNVVEVQAAYPGRGRSEYAVRRAQGRGHEGTATAVADWRVHAEQALVIVDGDYIQTGEVNRVDFDLDRDEMTVTSRTTDTPLGAIDLLPDTIDALTGTIADL